MSVVSRRPVRAVVLGCLLALVTSAPATAGGTQPRMEDVAAAWSVERATGETTTCSAGGHVFGEGVEVLRGASTSDDPRLVGNVRQITFFLLNLHTGDGFGFGSITVRSPETGELAFRGETFGVVDDLTNVKGAVNGRLADGNFLVSTMSAIADVQAGTLQATIGSDSPPVLSDHGIVWNNGFCDGGGAVARQVRRFLASHDMAMPAGEPPLPSIEDVSATVEMQVARSRSSTCTGADDDTYLQFRELYTGTQGSEDTRLAGNVLISAFAGLVNTVSGDGVELGTWRVKEPDSGTGKMRAFWEGVIEDGFTSRGPLFGFLSDESSVFGTWTAVANPETGQITGGLGLDAPPDTRDRAVVWNAEPCEPFLAGA